MAPSLTPRCYLHWLLAAGTTWLVAFGCGDSATDRVAEESGPRDFAGVYRVSGTTVELASGITRQLSGHVALRQEGEHYTTNFELSTEYLQQGQGDGMSAEVIGEGTGRVEGDMLRGSARTQFVLATVPGIDAGFAFVPRRVGPRIVSSTVAHLRQDGSIEIEIESQPEAGQQYRPTRTTLLGERIGAVGEAPSLPEVAAPSD